MLQRFSMAKSHFFKTNVMQSSILTVVSVKTWGVDSKSSQLSLAGASIKSSKFYNRVVMGDAWHVWVENGHGLGRVR